MYIRLYHGRNHHDEQLEDWGFEGPIIGDVGVSWTYGSLKIHGDGYFVSLPLHGDMIGFDGKFYGDFELIEKYDYKIHWRKSHADKVLSFEQAQAIVEPPADPDPDDDYDELLPF